MCESKKTKKQKSKWVRDKEKEPILGERRSCKFWTGGEESQTALQLRRVLQFFQIAKWKEIKSACLVVKVLCPFCGNSYLKENWNHIYWSINFNLLDLPISFLFYKKIKAIYCFLLFYSSTVYVDILENRWRVQRSSFYLKNR